MVSFRLIALMLGFVLSALIVAPAQTTSSSSDPQEPAAAAGQPVPQQPMSVQARIKARREKRRADAMHEAYGHLNDLYVGGGYLRFMLPSPLQRVNEKAWNVGATRYRSDRFGINIDGRGEYGTAYVYNNPANIWKPTISQYSMMVGPVYRFYAAPKFALSGRAMGGFAYGNFSGGTGGNGGVATTLHLYPNSYTYALDASVIGEYNISPTLALRLAPEYFATGFGSSSLQNNLGFTMGLAYRFGKR